MNRKEKQGGGGAFKPAIPSPFESQITCSNSLSLMSHSWCFNSITLQRWSFLLTCLLSLSLAERLEVRSSESAWNSFQWFSNFFNFKDPPPYSDSVQKEPNGPYNWLWEPLLCTNGLYATTIVLLFYHSAVWLENKASCGREEELSPQISLGDAEAPFWFLGWMSSSMLFREWGLGRGGLEEVM